MRQRVIIIGILVMLVSSLLVTIPPSSGEEINVVYVDDDAGQSWYSRFHVKTIQEGVDNASACDTIYVYPGVYQETITVYKSVTVHGENQATTVIDAGNNGTVVKITADGVTLSGLTISQSHEDLAGMHITANHTRISGTTISQNNYGIFVKSGMNNHISNCIITDNLCIGLYVFLSESNTISNNVINTNHGEGIKLQTGSDSNTITENTIGPHNTIGIGIAGSSNANRLIDNSITQNDHAGIMLHTSSHTIIQDNRITQNNEQGIIFGIACINTTIQDNTIAGNNINGITIVDSCEQTRILRNSVTANVGAGVHLEQSCSNNTIADNTISLNTIEGILLKNACTGNTISGNTITENYNGIALHDACSDNTISGNAITENTWVGISLDESDRNSVVANTVSHNKENGIRVRLSHHTIVTSNTISQNGLFGIYLTRSDYATVSNNTIREHSHHGIFKYTGVGTHIIGNTIAGNKLDNIMLHYVLNTTITGNTVTNSLTGHGIRFIQSSHSTIRENNITSNHLTGVFLEDNSNYNQIYRNNCMNNTEQNAYDECTNTWYAEETMEGNLWDDYEERYPGASKEGALGIWDTPYEIPGGDNQDRYPSITHYWVLPLEIYIPNSVAENQWFHVRVTMYDSPIKQAAVLFSGSTYFTDENGIASLRSPSVDQTSDLPITVSKEGYISQSVWITILNTDQPVEDYLHVSSPSTVTQEQQFTIIVSVNDTPIAHAQVMFDSETYVTNEMGMLTLTAPTVSTDTSYRITARHENYQSASVSLLVVTGVSSTEYGWVQGRITEQINSVVVPIENAHICAHLTKETDITTSKCVLSNESGNYAILLPIGSYILTAQKDEYTRQETEIHILPDATLVINFSLQPTEISGDSSDLENRELIDEAIKDQRVGGIIYFRKGTSNSSVESFIYLYDSLTINPRNTSCNNIIVSIKGDQESTGKTIIMTIEKDLFAKYDTLVIEYDGMLISEAANLSDVLNPDNDGNAPEYIITEGTSDLEIIISIPHFSEHIIVIQPLERVVETIGGPLALLLYVVACGLSMMIFMYPLVTGLISFRRTKKN